METLVQPTRKGDGHIVKAFEDALLGTDMSLLPITRSVLREATRLRATTRLKTPDALHAATAREAGCALFVTNDAGFRSVAGLFVVILHDFLTP